MSRTAKNTYYSGKDIYEGYKTNDSEKMKKGAAEVAKTATIGTIAVGIVDVAGDFGSEETSDVKGVEYNGEHFVEPHHVDGYVREDGVEVDSYWRDGDGDTSVDLTAEEGGGYYRSNPDV
ncbi:hypothetical protein [Salsuginibacillus kocurii]|uniref:hypothetical protein n=1 Tax=Salsuginibacillus kocurii TaxID=427078 RepID=UPI00039B83C6|nr:hypothetical protein [Salsuginibacillus kocurii]